jgi:hypothetical protein
MTRRKSRYDIMMEELEKEGKVKDVPHEKRRKILEGLKRDLEEYRASESSLYLRPSDRYYKKIF